MVPTDASMGVPGLDDILGGGLPRDRMYLLRGDPGVGKTTVGLQFLLAGRDAGESCVYIAMSESLHEIEAVVRAHGWSLDGIHVIELTAVEQVSGLDESENTLFEPNEVELQETTRKILAGLDQVNPQRVVFDSLSELRLLAQTPLRYRRQILALKQYFAGRRSTVIMLDDRSNEADDQQLLSLAHGVFVLEQASPIYGADRRRMRVAKLRGRRFRTGYHDLAIVTGGVQVFPRIIPAEHKVEFARVQLSSGIANIDALLGGGLDYGTSTLVLGPAGTGKSSLAIQYAVAAAARGERSAVFVFDERIATMLERTRALGCDLAPLIAAKQLVIHQIDPAEMGAGEFAILVREAAERDGCRLVVIDSLTGYLHAMANEAQLTVQLHELLSYLGNLGIATVMVMAQHGLTGNMQAPVDISYLADTVVLLRYFEADGRIRKAISIVKKRSGHHEDTIRELTLDARGLTVGPPLAQFTGVLTGVPSYVGATSKLAGHG